MTSNRLIFFSLFLITSCVIFSACTDSSQKKPNQQPEDTEKGVKVIIHEEPDKLPAEPDLPYPVAYTSERDGNTEVYITMYSGIAGVNVTRHESKDYGFRPFLDGGVFISQRDGDDDIFYVTFDGDFKYENLSNNPSAEKQLAVSLDLKKLLFTSIRDGDSDIFLFNPDGFPPKNITRNEAEDAFPVWMPNGESFLFESDRTGDNDIFQQSLDSSTARNITDNPARDQFPMVSSDGRFLAFESDRSDAQDIYLYSFDDNSTRNLTNDPEVDDTPLFSPDSRFIVWNKTLDGKSCIHRIDLATSEIKILTDRETINGVSQISPDSQYILFVSRRTGDFEIFMMGIDGDNQKQITNHPASDYYPVFLPSESFNFVRAILLKEYPDSQIPLTLD